MTAAPGEARTWAIGDIHGCLKTLQALWDRLPFDASRDRLWLVGDLVNRGPDSLGVLRWARGQEESLGSRFACVLGNHDLHLLAGAAGYRRVSDDLRAVLEAPDSDELIAWLRRRPILVQRDPFVLVHAGLWPWWSLEEAERWARRVEKSLGSEDWLLKRGKKDKKAMVRVGSADLESALYAFTALRLLGAEGGASSFKGPPAEAPAGEKPWFEAWFERRPEAREEAGEAATTFVCGHWAALGLHLEGGVLALDSGAAWGGPLSALCLEERQVLEQVNLDQPEKRIS